MAGKANAEYNERLGTQPNRKRLSFDQVTMARMKEHLHQRQCHRQPKRLQLKQA